MNNPAVVAFWNRYLDSLPEDMRPPDPALPEVWHFCDNAADANALGALVRAGIKTATCGLLWSYEAEDEPVPAAGTLSIITGWDGAPLCLIETTEVTIRAYDTVDARFAYDEGEGDRSLAYWRAAHWAAFSRECARIGRVPAEAMPLVCERFRVVLLA